MRSSFPIRTGRCTCCKDAYELRPGKKKSIRSVIHYCLRVKAGRRTFLPIKGEREELGAPLSTKNGPTQKLGSATKGE